MKFVVADWLESRLMLVPGIGPLLNLDYFAWLEDLEAMATKCEQDNIALMHDPALKIVLIFNARIYPHRKGRNRDLAANEQRDETQEIYLS